MSLRLPAPVPLDQPREDPAALEELAAAVTGGAFHLGLLGGHLTAPAASVRDWVGRDATAAVAQVGVLAGLVHDERDAVSAAAARIEAHAGRVREAVARVRALRAAQHEEFAAAVHRLSVLVGGPVDGAAVEPPEAVAVVEDWRAAEAHRLAQHAALLAELAEDAAATARVLAGCTAVVGGTGAPGDDGRVFRHLALTLPGWGDQELTARGAAFARLLSGGFHPDEWTAGAAQVADLAGTRAFADAALVALGVDGLARLLQYLGDGGALPGSPLASALAAVVAGAGGTAGAAGEVLRGRLVDPGDHSQRADLAAVGMGELMSLAAGRPGGVPTWLVAAWGGQIVAREAALLDRSPGNASSAGRVGAVWSRGAPDPVLTVVRLLVQEGDAAGAAELLSSSAAWSVLLARAWQDAGADLGRLLALAGERGGELGDAAVRAGLEALGAGLSSGDASHWLVDRTTVSAIAPVLAANLVEHTAAAVGVLRAGDAVAVSDQQVAALRGLGYLTLVPEEVAPAVDRALRTWVQDRADDAASTSTLSVVAGVLGAHVAVREYGQRLAYALHGVDAQAEATERARIADTIGFVLSYAGGRIGGVLGNLEPFVAHWVGADGTWDNGPDRGVVLTGEDAAVIALGAFRVSGAIQARAVLDQAARSFETVTRRVGVPAPPTSPEFSYTETLLEELSQSMPGKIDAEEGARAAKPLSVRAVVAAY